MKWSQKEINDIINRITKKYEIVTEIAKIYKVSPRTISILLKNHGISSKVDFSKRNDLKQAIVSNFFEKIDTEAKAYFLGLMYADGNVSTPKIGQKRMNINLHYQDKHILDTFKKYLNHNKPLTYRKPNNKIFNIKAQYVLRLSSNKLCDDLIQHGCIPNKTFSLNWPQDISNNLIRHFIRGLFDGDGCITFGSDLRKNRQRFKFQITGTKEICDGVNKVLQTALNFNITKKTHHKKSYSYMVGGNYKITQLFHYLYDDCDPKLRFIRKYNKFKKILNYNSKLIIKTSKYKHIVYRKSAIKKWHIIKWKGRKCKIFGKYSTEFDAYVALCSYEQDNNIPYSNNPNEYLQLKSL